MEFSYRNPTAIEFGQGKISAISELISKDQKVLFVYGFGSIKKNGAYDKVVKALEIVKKEKIDFILAIGGGSVIDGCKYLAAAAKYDGDVWDFLDGKAEVQDALPLGVVLTLAATGSESNNLTVVSRKATNEKRLYFQTIHILNFQF